MFLEPCTDEQRQMMYDEFKITDQSMADNVEHLKIWIEKQPHLPNVTDTDMLLHLILRCKNDMERTKKTVDTYYCSKAAMPDIFSNRDVCSAGFAKCYNLATYVPLPKLTPEGYRVGIYRVNCSSTDSMPSKEEFLKATQIMADVILKVDTCAKTVIIADFTAISLSFCTLMLLCLKRMLTLSTKVVPYRYQKIYVVKMIPAVEPLIFLAKKIAKKEIGDRIKIWKKKPEQLVEEIPADILPPMYGGTGKPFEELRDLWLEELKSHYSWLQSEEKVIADLSKRPKKPKFNDEISFRNMNID